RRYICSIHHSFVFAPHPTLQFARIQPSKTAIPSLNDSSFSPSSCLNVGLAAQAAHTRVIVAVSVWIRGRRARHAPDSYAYANQSGFSNASRCSLGSFSCSATRHGQVAVQEPEEVSRSRVKSRHRTTLVMATRTRTCRDE
ncbi:unnamed protein product, partial [Ectocarpus fasciculatus]